ncbi:tudor and KH domain-containing protein isoform X1 [Osmerus mordax]|uniref:tudor and KH domain-containing protein isoform X1 n=2 Tax=Osmerus mordax TaxID=8014 RepID=UPI00351059A0
MEVGISKSQVFLNCSPRSLLSQWSVPLTSVMEAGSKGTLSTGKMAALAAGLSVGAATLGYIVYRSVSSNTPELADPESSRMTVSLEVYRNISRYQAGFLDLVSQQSGAQVRVQTEGGDPSSQQAVCLQLRGSAEQVLRARCAVDKLASDCEPTCHAMEVPYSAFGRIIGRGGETLKFIARTTGAKVNCPRERGRSLEEKGKVSITGTRLEVRQAKEMILEKVLEDQTVRMRISQASARRQKRRPHDPEVTEAESPPEPINEAPCPAQGEGFVLANGPAGEPVGVGDTECKTLNGDVRQEEEEEEDVVSPDSLSDVSKFEIPSPDLSFQPDEHLEVYVSASENPHHFWIQILGVRSLQLDKLTQEMSRFYSNETLPEQRVEALVVGDIVAAPYRDHGTWNRARVLGVLGGPSGLVDLYYVDYGDNGELPRDSLRSMRSDFLSLPFQAIECSLADVSPAGEVWSEAAMDDFDRLTYCAEWRPLLAKLCSYSHSEVSSWPSVKLYDKSQGKAGDLGEELIALGHAVLCQDTGNGHGDRDDAGSLQRMLDDVTGATSELSLSCISLSEVASISGSVDDVIEDEMT